MSSVPPNPSDTTPPRQRRARGERSWHNATEPLFLLNAQRRLVYVNPAWEQTTGIAWVEARGRVCRRRPATTAVEPIEQVLAALAPPPDAVHGRPCQARRRAPGKKLSWWEIDFFPWSNADGVLAMLGKLHVVAESGPAHAALPEKLVQLRLRQQQLFQGASWHSDVPVFRRLIEQIRLAAQTRTPALIHGPPGSGKEWTARTIHCLGEQRESFFACLDARLPAAVFADVLATCRHSRLGTLYLKNVERLSRDVQELLLQHLDADTVEPGARLLAGSSVDVEQAVRAGRVLPQLLARLSVFNIEVPRLNQRLADLPHLVRSLLDRVSQASGHSVDAVSPAALELLQRHGWPGNVAELFDVMVEASRSAKTTRLDIDDLPFHLRQLPVPPAPNLPLDETLAKVERRLIELAMRLAQGNKTRAAELLAIWRPRLTRRLELLGMEPKDEEPAPE